MQKPTITPTTKRVQTNTCTTIQETSHTNTNAPNKSTNTSSTRVEPSLPPLKPHQKQIKDAALIFQLTWYRRHENDYQIASIDEKESYFKQNHIIILPPDLKMPFAITHYVTELNQYVKIQYEKQFLSHQTDTVYASIEEMQDGRRVSLDSIQCKLADTPCL